MYTPEYLAERAKQEPDPEVQANIQGDMSILPPWIVELHNRLAPITA